MQRIPALIAGAALILGAASAHAAGNPAAGEQKSQTCASCHGENGRSPNDAYPVLAGQHQSYLYHALKAYKTGARQNPVMGGLVANLTDQDMRDLAAYYASQDGGLFTLGLGLTDE